MQKKNKIKSFFTIKYWRNVLINIQFFFKKYFYHYPHRSIHGWAPYDIISLNDYIINVLIGSITYLKNIKYSYPVKFHSMEEWQDELQSLIDALLEYKNYEDNKFKRLELLYKEYNIPLYDKIRDEVTLNEYINSEKYKLPHNVRKRFYKEENKIKNEITNNLKNKLFNNFDNLWI